MSEEGELTKNAKQQKLADLKRLRRKLYKWRNNKNKEMKAVEQK